MNFRNLSEEEDFDLFKITSFDKNNLRSDLLMEIQKKCKINVNIKEIKKFHEEVNDFFKIVYKIYFNEDIEEEEKEYNFFLGYCYYLLDKIFKLFKS